MKKSPRTVSLIDASADGFFQNLDIDFLQERTDGAVIKYEVKTDTQAHRTGNIVWERTTSGHVGCLEKSQADYILYYLSETKTMLGFNPARVRKLTRTNRYRLTKMGDNATGWLLPIAELKEMGIIKEIKEATDGLGGS